VEVVLDTILLVEARPRLGRLGPQVLDRVVAVEFERDQVVDSKAPCGCGKESP
jgi:hypothetical protein